MNLYLVECGPVWLAPAETWWVVTEQKTRNEARRFAARYCRVKFPGLTRVADDARVKRVDECPLSVCAHQLWAWSQPGPHRERNARISIYWGEQER